MSDSDSGISGFWLFMIGIFIVLPIIESLSEKEEEDVTTVKTGVKVVSSKGGVLEISGDTATTAINTEVKIPIHKKTAIVKKVSPDKGKPEVIAMKGEYAITSFNQTGSWDINMYDINNFLVDWVKIIVH